MQYTGNYAYFKEQLKEETQEEDDKPVKKQRVKTQKPLKFTYNEQREWETIDKVIEDIESEINKINEKMEESSSDYTKLEELLKEKEILESKLEEKMERWVYLSELAEKIGKNV